VGGRGYPRAKRWIDLAVAVPGTLVSLPVVAATAVAIRLESPGNPVFTQLRAGRHGRPFRLFKLRTMVKDAETLGEGLRIAEGDARITRLGGWLRRLSIDELPQLWNVVRGDMSLIGPRPTLQYQVDEYTPHQRRRLEVQPGITGWAQVNGRAALPWSERIELDVWYVDHLSLRLDLRILARTLPQVFGGVGLYRGTQGGWTPPDQEQRA
jgi:lipopolysaccharide/colanic/teichoic acid biosynthesis glycosyltransferase